MISINYIKYRNWLFAIGIVEPGKVNTKSAITSDYFLYFLRKLKIADIT